jgi:hypothetical protein
MAVQHARLSKHRGIDSITLSNLGRINVICGKNNSGKSSILQAMTTPSSCEVGVPVDLEQLAKTMAIYMDMKFDHPKSPDGVLRDMLSLEFASDATWFRGDANSLSSRFQRARDASPFGRRSVNMEGIHKAFQEMCHAEVKSLLIPAKRHLQERDRIGPPPQSSPDGTGVLGRLFHMNNRVPTHEDHAALSMIRAKFNEITRGFEFGVFAEGGELLLKFKVPGRDWVDATECGLGLQDLVVLLFFAFTAEENVLCIEEPENHLHPEMQKALLRVLKSDTDKQYVFSTHSNIFLNPALADRVFLSTIEDGKITSTDNTSRADMLSELGYDVADNLVSDVVILVEGPTDVPVLEELLLKRGTLTSYAVKMWPLGGDIMQYVDLSVLGEHKKVLALIDGDPGSAKVRARFVKKCDDAGIQVRQLSRYSLENYFTVAALRAVFKGQMREGITLDGGKDLAEQLGFEVKNNNRRIARAMVLADIADTDLGDFIESVDSFCRS